MKFIEEFQTKESILPVIDKLKQELVVDRTYTIMEFCGGHTHSFLKSGLIDILPQQIELVHGPGCPVCVLPTDSISHCIDLMEQDANIVVATYADLMKVPTHNGETLLEVKARGLQVLPVYSPLEALDFAKQNPQKKIVFLAIGFETTIPPTVMVLKQAIDLELENFSVYCNHLNTAMALESILLNENKGGALIQGFIGPGHVSLVTGSAFFKGFAKSYNKPIVISGFTPYDLALSLLMLVKQINLGTAEVEVEYSRAVTREGNLVSQRLINEFLELRETFTWRGLGALPNSAFRIRSKYRKWDAESLFGLEGVKEEASTSCLCSSVLRGETKPTQCKFFGKDCTPEHPKGPCMASGEGACSAYYVSGKHLPTREPVGCAI